MLIALPPRLSALETLAQSIEDFAEGAGLRPSDAMRLNLVLDELFTNAVDYGRQPADGTVEITLARGAGETRVTIEDRGVCFDPLDIPPPDLDSELEDRPIGGLGIHFLMTFMTDPAYRNDNGVNRLTFRQVDSAEPEAESE